jgi:hypothetical protein
VQPAVSTLTSERALAQDLCVGDFWETQERRSIATFTTAIAVDKFQLVTITAAPPPKSMFQFPTAFASSRSSARPPASDPPRASRARII